MIAAVISRNDYVGTGTAGPFVYSFRIISKDHLEVLKDGVLLVVDTDYTVASVGDPTGSITLAVALAVGANLTILRKQPLEQLSDYTTEAFPPERVEKDYDKIVMALQMFKEMFNRALMFTKKSLLTGPILPDGVTGKILRWKSTTELENITDPTGGLTGPAGPTGPQGLPGTGAPIVREVDGAPSISTVDVIEFDQADGFVVSNPVGLNARIKLVMTAAIRAALGLAGLSDQNTFTKRQEWAKGANVLGAATLSLGTDGNYFEITGGATITAISTTPAGTLIQFLFNGVHTLTHNATSLILPNNGSNITTAAGDSAIFISLGAGNYRCLSYIRADGKALQVTASGVTILDRVTANTTVANTVVETTIYTKNILGGTLSTNVRLRLVLAGKVNYISGQTQTWRLKYGATTLLSVIVLTDNVNQSAADAGFHAEFLLTGDGTTGTQHGEGSVLYPPTLAGETSSDTKRGTSAEDSTLDKTLTITVQHSVANAGTLVVIESAVLEQI